MRLFPILPGGWCVPSAIQCLTGADYASVIHPAINRHSLAAEKYGLCSLVTGVHISVARKVLEELGCDVRQAKSLGRHQIRTWAKRSAEKYPGRVLCVSTAGHMLVIKDGRVYDTFAPAGADGAIHPYARDVVTWCALVKRRGV